MSFVSIDWLFWMAATVSLYWLFPRGWRDRFLIGITIAFLGFVAPISALVLCSLTIAVYFLTKARPLPAAHAVAAATLVLGVLVYFKLGADHTQANLVRDIAVPLGLAYYTIRLVLYIIDSYIDALPDHTFEQFVSYLFFLPTMVIGPIHRFDQFHKDYQYKRWDGRQLSAGLQRLIYGYAKIVILGNYLITGVFGSFVGAMDPSQAALQQYLEIVRQGLNLYMQFSGYSDVAIGFSLLLGYRIIENFRWPYLQKNISDFWRSWHISLTSFARDHIYRVVFAMSRSRYLGVLMTMLFVGLWHELSLRYIVWGAYHGIGIMIWQLTNSYVSTRMPDIGKGWWTPVIDTLKIFLTVNFVWMSFVIVRQPSLGDALEVYRTVFLSWL